MFVLHPQLASDTTSVGRLPLCELLLVNDANYPWCILVPQPEDIREIHQLSVEDRRQMLDESCWLSEIMEQLFQPVKMNVATLGNQVPQLHIHHIARLTSDVAWPNPVWGMVPPLAYQERQRQERVALLKGAFQDYGLVY